MYKNSNIIYEQSQASSNMMTQHLDDTRGFLGMAPGFRLLELRSREINMKETTAASDVWREF